MTDKEIIYITAGEESGDLLGAEVIRNIRAKNPGVTIKGIGGMEMQSCGLVPVFDSEKLGFMGFFELIKHVLVIKQAMNAVFGAIKKDRPSVVLMIDFSEFHIKLARKIKTEMPEIKIVKYVSPQIWASRKGRIDDIEKYYDCLCCILPFEPEIYKNRLIDCRYTGHPLMDKFELKLSYEQFYEKFGLCSDKTLVCIFPGSRVQEIRKHMPVISSYVRSFSERHPDVEMIICRSSNIPEKTIKDYLSGESVRIIPSEFQWEAVSYSSIAVCKSGTSALQAAIAQTPSIVFYRISPLSYFIAKRIVKLKYISLPNIIAGKQINPELIQAEFNPENLMSETLRLLNNQDIYELRKNELGLVKDALGGKGAASKVADAVIEYSGINL